MIVLPVSPNQASRYGTSFTASKKVTLSSFTEVESVRSFWSATAQNAPSMNSAPCAKLTTPSVPKTSVSPSAMSA